MGTSVGRVVSLPRAGHVSYLYLSNSYCGRPVLTCCAPETSVPLTAHVVIAPSLLPVSSGVTNGTTGLVMPSGHSIFTRVGPVGAAGHTMPA